MDDKIRNAIEYLTSLIGAALDSPIMMAKDGMYTLFIPGGGLDINIGCAYHSCSLPIRSCTIVDKDGIIESHPSVSRVDFWDDLLVLNARQEGTPLIVSDAHEIARILTEEFSACVYLTAMEKLGTSPLRTDSTRSAYNTRRVQIVSGIASWRNGTQSEEECVAERSKEVLRRLIKLTLLYSITEQEVPELGELLAEL